MFRCHPQMSGGAKLNGFLIRLDQGGALVFAIFGFHRIVVRTILCNEQNKSVQSFYRTQSHGIDDFEFTRNRILWSYRKDAPILAVPKSAAEVHNYTGKKRG
ncbi:MAG: hypothetical protein J6E41_10725, partial [Lachnospiraceae bacterium]|nr:hypothetical protein [Lachnospiraceae bacterium]